jgi:hypothetical protein
MYWANMAALNHLPWCERNPNKLGQTVTNFMLEHERYYNSWAQKWFENQQFVYGNHNLKWSRRYGIAVDVDFLSRTPSISRKSQTNITRVVVEALASMIYSDLPTWDAQAMDESSTQGKRYKVLCQKILDCYMSRLCMDQELKMASYVYVTYGQLAFKIDWKKNAGRIRKIPVMEQQQVTLQTTGMEENGPFGPIETPVESLNSNGEPMTDIQWVPVLDEQGQQKYKHEFTGDVSFDVLTPFEYRREPGSPGMHKAKWIEQIRLMDYDDFIQEYKDLDGQTGNFMAVKPGAMNADLFRFAFKHFMRMAFITPQMMSDSMSRAENPLSSNLFKHKVLVIEHYDKPNPDFWEYGRKTVVANGLCTHVTKPSYQTNKLDGWHPFVEVNWLNVAPSSISSAPINDVVSKNKELNAKDSLIYTATLRNMGSQLLIKTGSGLDPMRITGTPGQIHEVSDPTTAARYLHDEQPIPPVINQLRQQDKEDVYEVSGAGEALRGERSKGISAGYALRQQQEREEKRLTPARKNFAQAVGNSGEKILYCLKSNLRELDPDVMGFLMRSAAGEFDTQDVISFLARPLDYGVDVKIDETSMAYKSKATAQATISDLVKSNPAVAALLNHPKTLDTYLKFFDVEALRDPRMVHTDRAGKENEVFSDMLRLGGGAKGLNQPEVMKEDDDLIHMADHEEWALQNSSELQKNPTLLLIYTRHQNKHAVQYQEKQGKVPVGTTQTSAQQSSMAQNQPAKPVQQVFQEQQQKQQQQAQQPAPPGQAPAAPTQPKPPGEPGPRPQDPNAPAANTQQGRRSPTQGGGGVQV